MGLVACSGDSSTADDSTDATANDTSMDSARCDVRNPSDGSSGDTGNEPGDDSSSNDAGSEAANDTGSEAANDTGSDAGNDGADDAGSDGADDAGNDAHDGAAKGSCITSDDCNDGGFRDGSTMWCNHNDDNLTYNRPDGGTCPNKPGKCVHVPAASSCPSCGNNWDTYCGCNGIIYPPSPNYAHRGGTNVEYIMNNGFGSCP
jgi:hypothetical protein